MSAMPIHLERLINRRTQEIESSTRTEILTSLAAAFLFAGAMLWRFQSNLGTVPQIGLVWVVLWAGFVFYRFRGQILGRRPSLAATGLDHYRASLIARRDHLKSTWIWHGPLLLSCLTFAAIPLQVQLPDYARVRNMLPFIGLLVLWVAMAQLRRNRTARELQREIEDLECNTGS